MQEEAIGSGTGGIAPPVEIFPEYPITDVRHYGVFPGIEVSEETKQAVIDASSNLGITITWPPGLYMFSLELNRSNVSFHLEEGAEFAGTFHISSAVDVRIGDPPISNISITGTLVVYDRVGTINARFVEIERIVTKSDPAISTSEVGGRGVHIYFGSQDFTIGEIIVEDMGGQLESPTNHAAVAIDGFGDNPQRIAIGRIEVRDSAAHGVYVTGLDHVIGSIEVHNYAREPLVSALQDATLADSLNGAGVWFNRGSATVGSIEVHGVADGSRPEQHAGVIFDQSEIIWTVPGQSWVAGDSGVAVETVTVASGPGMLINPYGQESLAVIGTYFAPSPAPELLTDPHIAAVASPQTGDGEANTLQGGDASDYLMGLDAADMLFGGGNRDRLEGGAGDDLLRGDGGDDTALGGTGDDRFFIDSTADRVVELAGEGSDRVFASVSYTLAPGVSIERLTTDVNAGTAPLALTGNELANAVYGNAGANRLDGGGGGDQLIGFGGDDQYVVRTAADRVVEVAGEGTDRVFATVSYVLPAGVEIERLTTSDNLATTPIALTGNERPDLIYGNAGANRLDGGGGGDQLVGFDGDDQFVVRSAADRVYEVASGGSDRVFATVSYVLPAGAEIERLTTIDNLATTAIALTGNERADLIYGNAGANVLDGKGGADTLVGMGGADTFRFSAPLGAGNVDRLADFTSGLDQILLDRAVFAGLAAGVLPAEAFQLGAVPISAEVRILYLPQTGALLFDSDGSGAAAAIQFAALQPLTALNAGDILIG